VSEPEQNDGPFTYGEQPDAGLRGTYRIMFGDERWATMLNEASARLHTHLLNDAYKLGHDAAQSAAAGTIAQLEAALRKAHDQLREALARLSTRGEA
jgi:hypothetical protein